MTPCGPIARALKLSRPCLVAVAGSGGKTGLIRALARELASFGQKVLVSTTTKIYPPLAGQGDLRLFEAAGPGPARLAGLARPGRPVTLARRRLSNGKLEGLLPGELSALAREDGLWVLVEADGSARRPLKAWAPWEPVVPEDSGLVVLVLGARGLNRPLDGRYVHRPGLFAAQSGLAPKSPVTPKALAKVVLHPAGPLARMPEGTRPLPIITGRQAAGPETLAELARLLEPACRPALCAGMGFNGLAKLAS